MTKNTSELESVLRIKIPQTDFYGYVEVNGVKIPCAVLYPFSENPVRVFWQREVVGLLTGNKKGGLDRYFQPKNLLPFIPEKFKNKPLSESTFTFKVGTTGRKAQGFDGSDIIDICKMYMQARDVLLPNQKHLLKQAEVIVFTFAKTGVNSWIDEATGFDKIRSDYAIRRMVQKYMAEELRPYEVTFPNKFYRKIYELNNWQYDENNSKRPGVVGKWTNQIIYSRFPKGVFTKIKELNPRLDSGQLKNKNFQWLSEEDGINALKEYISNAIFLMDSSSNWRKFKSALAKATGQSYQVDMFDEF